MKLAIVTCYKQPDYIRGLTLRTAAQSLPETKVLVVKNRHTGLLRYPEVFLRLIWLRLRHRPNVYILTFRGVEVLPIVALMTWPKILIYDELVHPFSWLNEPGREQKASLLQAGLLKSVYRLFLKRCIIILADTDVHAAYNADLNQLPLSRYATLPVSTDEQLFKPLSSAHSDLFRVFYYGNMLPLHGLQYVLDAAVELKKMPIEFRLVGGKEAIGEAVAAAQAKGANISYATWIPFADIPSEVAASQLCLGGPFGNTTQAQLVVTGKTYQFLASGAPVLIGETKATDRFRDKENCLMVSQADVGALVQAIKWAQAHPAELKTIGQRGRELYMREFSEQVVADKLKTILGNFF